MAAFADGKIEAYVGPPGLGAGDDLEAVIVGFIAGAWRKLDIAVQELDSQAIAQAHHLRLALAACNPPRTPDEQEND
jgi:hypothetical protein